MQAVVNLVGQPPSASYVSGFIDQNLVLIKMIQEELEYDVEDSRKRETSSIWINWLSQGTCYPRVTQMKVNLNDAKGPKAQNDSQSTPRLLPAHDAGS